MPSGITHMTFSRFALDHVRAGTDSPRTILSANKGLYLLGCVGPDLPYLSIATSHALEKEDKIADCLHYENTNAVPIGGLYLAREAVEKGDLETARGLFSFFVGYASHLVADGVVHPYIRDKVGEYAVAKTEHRTLEMKLDVIVVQHYYGVELNGLEFQDDLRWIDDSSVLPAVQSAFAKLVSQTYPHAVDASHVDRWTRGILRLLEFAEGRFPRWYRNLLGDHGATYKDYDDLKSELDDLLVLHMPIDAEIKKLTSNFANKERVHFIEDVIPKYFEIFPGVIEQAYDFVFNSDELDKNLIPAINLDNGRLLTQNVLTETPTFWRQT